MDSLPRVPQNLQIGEEISRGAYGLVLVGLLGSKPAALKTIHQLLLDHAGPGELEATLTAFTRECQLLQTARDPHIVEFLGFWKDERHGSILVMELMDGTLADYLQKHRGWVSRRRQIKLCQQVASGLRYLHYHDPQILHRDLTPKNILLKGKKAKISDLGQAKFRPPSVSYLTTKAPGCVPYMPPECLRDKNPKFDAKGDVFSMGVVMLEIATQQPPSCWVEGIGVVPEVERRADDLSKVPDDYPLKSLIKLCLKDDPKERPIMDQVHSEFLQLQQKFITLDLTSKYESSHIHSVSPLAMQLLSTEVKKKETQIFHSDVLLQGKRLQSIQLPGLPIAVGHASAVLLDNKVFVGGGTCADVKYSELVQVYDVSTGKWTTLPPSPIYYSEAIAVNGEFTLFGGRDVATHKVTNKVTTWDEVERKWTSKLLPMPTARSRPCILQNSNLVVVWGGMAGDDNTLLNSVDVYNTDTYLWSTPTFLKLPEPMWDMRISVSNGYAYIASFAPDTKTATKRAYRASLEDIDSAITKEQEIKWHPIKTTPHFTSRPVISSDPLMVVGGYDKSYCSSSDISIYNPVTEEWSTVGQCTQPHMYSCCIAISSSSFLAIGGRSNPSDRTACTSCFEMFYV